MKTNLDGVRKAIRLWPDASDAPEVPPESVLLQYLNDRIQLDPDLCDQIEGSVNCQRELEFLRQRKIIGPPALDAATRAFFDSLPTPDASEIADVSSSKCEQPESPPQNHRVRGQVWSTNSRVEHWTGEQFVNRWTYLPCDVLLVSDGEFLRESLDTVYDAVPLSAAELWPPDLRCNEDISIEVPVLGDVVAHLWLKTKVSGIQLASYLGDASKKELQRVDRAIQPVCSANSAARKRNTKAAAIEDEVLPKFTAEVAWERERLQACAKWLNVAADTYASYGKSLAQKCIKFPPAARPVSREPVETELEMAAGTRRTVPSVCFSAESLGLKIVIEHESTAPDSGKTWPHSCLAVYDYDASKNPSRKLDKAVVTTCCGNSEPIKGGQTRFPTHWLADGFRIRRPDGSFVVLTNSGESKP